MTNQHHSPAALASPPFSLPVGQEPEEKLPLPQAAALIVVLSLSLWTAIGLGVRWLVA